MNKRLRVLVSGMLLAVLVWSTDWRQVGDVFGHIQPRYWLSAVALYVVTQIVSAWRWQILAQPLGFDQPLRHYCSFYFIGMFFNLILPTSMGGDVIRAWYLDGKSGRRLNAFLSVFLDRFSGLLMLLILAAAASAFSPIDLPSWVVLSVGLMLTAALAGLAALPFAARWPILGRRVARFSNEVRRAFRHVLKPLPVVLSLVVQSANVILVWLVGLAVSAAVPGSYYWIVVPMVTLLTLLPVSINGMGVREGAMILFLTPLNIPAGTAVSLAFLWFSVFTTASVFGGVIYLFGRFTRPEVHSDHGTVSHHSDQGRSGQYQAAA